MRFGKHYVGLFVAVVIILAISAGVYLYREANPGASNKWNINEYVDITKPPYNAIGDGIADNYQVLSSALAALNNGQYPVLYFPPGEYRIAIPPGVYALRVPSTMAILGQKDVTTIKFDITNTGLYSALKFETGEDFMLKDIILEGTKLEIPFSQSSYWTVVSVNKSSGIHFEGITIKNGQRFGLEVMGSNDVNITDSNFIGNGWAEEVAGNAPQHLIGGVRVVNSTDGTRSSRVYIARSNFSNNGGEGLLVSRSDNLRIKANTVSNNGLYRYHGNQDGIALSGLTDSRISKNIVSGNFSDGIVLTVSSNIDSSHDVEIYDNKSFNNGGNGILLYSLPDSNTGVMSFVIIDSNEVYNNGLGNTSGYPYSFDGIRVSPWGAGNRITGVSIRNNVCYDTRTGLARTQMHGIGQLPREIDTNGGISKVGVILGSNDCYNNEHAQIWLWELEQMRY